MCVVEVSTTPPIFWEMMLYDPYTNDTTNVTDRFRVEYAERLSVNNAGGLYYTRSRVQ